MKKMLIATVAAFALSGAAQAATVDFESGPFGSIAEGTNIGGIVFTSANGGGLNVSNFTPQSNGNGLAAFSDADGNFIKGAISGGASALSIAFGNDDPFFSNPGDLATLKVFSGATLLSTITVLLNRDDIINQTIGYAGTFDNFSFAYTNAAGNPFTGGGATNTGLIEVIDDISYTPGGVPEPASWALMIAGFGLVGAASRRRQRVAVTYA